jgi:hypothetical protein
VDGRKLGHRLERNDDPPFNEQVDAIAAADLHIAINYGQPFWRSTRSPHPASSNCKQASQVDSSNPGPNSRWTSIAAPMICSVTSFNLISAPSAFSAVIRYRICETQHSAMGALLGLCGVARTAPHPGATATASHS